MQKTGNVVQSGEVCKRHTGGVVSLLRGRRVKKDSILHPALKIPWQKKSQEDVVRDEGRAWKRTHLLS